MGKEKRMKGKKGQSEKRKARTRKEHNRRGNEAGREMRN